MTDAEMVRLAAKKVMGWKFRQASLPEEKAPFYSDVYGGRREVFVLLWEYSDESWGSEVWNPLTSDSDCWMLVDSKRADYCVTVSEFDEDECHWTPGTWHVVFCGRHGLRNGEAIDRDRRRAIVLACLRALGEEVNQ